ncbi:MAG: FAD-dependent oxidoreductase [Sulfuriferula sp.]|nr:FAD-dependent oxidoreductase [Sulfuriferula sp.]
MANITIIGAGFGALTAIRALRRQSPDAHITLVAPAEELLYYPSLIWIPSGLRNSEDLRIPLTDFCARESIHFYQGRVTGIKHGGRAVVTDCGEIGNDALIIASGGRFLKSLPGIEHAITLCAGTAAADNIRDRLQNMHYSRNFKWHRQFHRQRSPECHT